MAVAIVDCSLAMFFSVRIVRGSAVIVAVVVAASSASFWHFLPLAWLPLVS